MLFTAKELRTMDAPTADNEVVLASLGGKPRIPDDKHDNDDEEDAESSSPGTDTKHSNSDNAINAAEEDKWSAAERGVRREGIRERAGA